MGKICLAATRKICNKKGFDMKTIPQNALRFSLWTIATAMLAGAFWFAASPSGFAGNTCMVCHKNATTLTLPCNSLDYRRHKDHGDPDGMCAGTPGSRIDDSAQVDIPRK
jgi:hypothetical protein